MRFKKHLLGWLAATLLFSSQTQAAPLRAWRALTMRRWRVVCLSRRSCSVP
ncbi:hypothetical protein GP350_001159 [Salmonella enterica subsp. enterica serovar Typhimurium]|nr:hypothetical protein [Salmonella enterica subsp. enterica serovar Typhimurium]